MAWPVRYNMIGLLFLSTVVNYIDRVNISVAAPVIMKETGWDKGQFGLVFSAFLIGYARGFKRLARKNNYVSRKQSSSRQGD